MEFSVIFPPLNSKQMLVIWHVLHLNMCPGFRTEGLPLAVWRGGESEALDRLNKHMDKKVTQAEANGGYEFFLLLLFWLTCLFIKPNTFCRSFTFKAVSKRGVMPF